MIQARPGLSSGVVLFALVLATAPSAIAATLFSDGAQPRQGRQVTALAVPAGPACSGLSNTTGNPATAIAAGVSGIYVQRFTPPAVPFLIGAVCIGGFSGSLVPAPYDVLIYTDANGEPGALLATIPATPAAPGSFPGTWMSTSITGSPVTVTGAFWAGFRVTTAPQFTLDFEATDALVPQRTSMDGGATFGVYPPTVVASVVVAGAQTTAIPTLSGAALVFLLAGLAASGFAVLRRG